MWVHRRQCADVYEELGSTRKSLEACYNPFAPASIPTCRGRWRTNQDCAIGACPAYVWMPDGGASKDFAQLALPTAPREGEADLQLIAVVMSHSTPCTRSCLQSYSGLSRAASTVLLVVAKDLGQKTCRCTCIHSKRVRGEYPNA